MARPRTPTALKIVKGTAKKYRINKAEPKPSRGMPDCPDYLSDRAKEVWPLVSVLLDKMGVLTTADQYALIELCETYAELRTARATLKDRGAQSYETMTKSGETIFRPYPEVTIIADADRRMRNWLASFGLTPADRSKVSAREKENENPWDEFA